MECVFHKTLACEKDIHMLDNIILLLPKFHSYAGLIVFLENFKLAPQGFALAVDSAHITLSQFFKKLIPFIVQVSAQLLLLQSPFLISLLKLYLRSITTTLTS